MSRDWELWFAYMDEAPPTENFEVITVDIPVDVLPLLSHAAETLGVRTTEFLELSVWEALVNADA